MKKRALFITGSVIILVAVGFFSTNLVIKQNQKEKQIYIYKNLITLIDSFHTEIKTLSPSVNGKDQLQEELRKMKTYAQGTKDRVKYLSMEASNVNSLALNESIEKTDKYLSGFEQLANLSITRDALSAKSDSMLKMLEHFRLTAQVYGSPDEGDTTEAIDRAFKLSTNFDKARKSIHLAENSPKISNDRVIVVGNYWTNPEYSDYRQQIFQIVAEYSNGRKNLSRVLSHYDKGILNDNDRSQWSTELNKRRNLLNRINSLSDQIPPYSIYKDHHNLLQQMLSNAVEAMENFANNENSSTRRYLSFVSSKNTAIMNRLKRFYGIR
ncbi:MAG: hypothetical protein UR93_C0016G0007 [Berkelbacteria bacterium GW2011_GWA2_35_9]|uniref:Uncharacterized protein n=1 Tax=Berkelbacteria bacterium GW2011_GWA2_35_9 TaxID=1618333 RepID=A0A0G0G9E6_9BACT|nr:MAG: hypothetical protein UR93_C0016G0007 [Berkelbacteria bacterium GW2011_GWA2_35_9]